MTSKLADAVIEGAKLTGHECREIFLPDLAISDCQGCRACQEKLQCVIRNDDIGKLEEAISWADMIVFATPTHWGNISGYLLRAMERLFGYLIVERKYGVPLPVKGKGKKAFIVTACSTIWPMNFIFNQTRSVKKRFAGTLK
jgi:multimeric flavodoxin WrbA